MRIRDVSASRLDFVWREYASRMRRRDRPRVARDGKRQGFAISSRQ